MHTIVTQQQINHFNQFGWIEFEGFVRPETLQKLSEAVQKKAGRFHSADRAGQYAATRDCWRSDVWIKQTELSQPFVSTAVSLTNGKGPLLLACDQWIAAGSTFEPMQMQAHLSFQNLLCGCLLSLDGETAGRARFCHPSRLPLFPTGSQLLIAYGSMNTLYVHNAADPLNPSLKSFGYSFGDRLKPPHHPLSQPKS